MSLVQDLSHFKSLAQGKEESSEQQQPEQYQWQHYQSRSASAGAGTTCMRDEAQMHAACGSLKE